MTAGRPSGQPADTEEPDDTADSPNWVNSDSAARDLPASGWRGWAEDVRAALPGWIAARVIVGLAIAAAWWVRTHSGWSIHGEPYGRDGLMGWDAEWYALIARRGYDAVGGSMPEPHEGVRFFPLLPVLARMLGAVIGVPAALLLLANGPALALGAAVHRLAWVETERRDVASLAAYLVALAPPAFVLVMGYTEPIALLCVTLALLWLRSGRWWAVAAANLVGGFVRPTGLLIGLPTLVESSLRLWRRLSKRRCGMAPASTSESGKSAMASETVAGGQRGIGWELLGMFAACAAPAVGAATFVAFCWWRYRLPLAPFTIQSSAHLRGGTVNPMVTVWETIVIAVTQPTRFNLHRATVLISLALTVPTVRRWAPRLWTYALLTLAVAFAGARLGSLERYVWGSVVLVLTVAWLVAGRTTLPIGVGRNRSAFGWGVLALSAAGMFVCATTAFLGTYVP